MAVQLRQTLALVCSHLCSVMRLAIGAGGRLLCHPCHSPQTPSGNQVAATGGEKSFPATNCHAFTMHLWLPNCNHCYRFSTASSPDRGPEVLPGPGCSYRGLQWVAFGEKSDARRKRIGKKIVRHVVLDQSSHERTTILQLKVSWSYHLINHI